MTNVEVTKQANFISKVEIKGHALSAQYGHDVVCAGISSVVTGICNALEALSQYDEDMITFEEGHVSIPQLMNDEQVQLIINVLIVQLKTIEEKYSNYIEISYL